MIFFVLLNSTHAADAGDGHRNPFYEALGYAPGTQPPNGSPDIMTDEQLSALIVSSAPAQGTGQSRDKPGSKSEHTGGTGGTG